MPVKPAPLATLACILTLALPAAGASAPTVRITADTVLAREAGQVIEARGAVTITDGRITIRADHLLYTRRDRRIRLTGHVAAVTPQGDLRARQVVVTLTPAGALEAVEAAGEVTVRSADRTLQAGRVRYRPVADIMEATDGVVLRWADRTLQADRVRYEAGKTFDADGGVTVRWGDRELTARRVVGVAAGQVLEASEDAVARWADRTIRADRMVYRLAEDVLTATGGVTLTTRNLAATAQTLVARGARTATLGGRARMQTPDGELQADRIDVQVQEQTAQASGNVMGVFQDTTITSQAATLSVPDGYAVFRGQVTVRRPGRTLTADVVTFYYREHRLVAQGETTIRIQPETP
ncbi:MAG: LptA/OstA family protein [Armatimonadota bacterium]|nr:LptA/OstA family protein [Armatimonadota bacterium]MDR7436047.1 LptA/OstA family protein [Armatimonadota bacterium]MDR7471926.1 LptA/OstA family protein [Armatimonadota bacterium]MDR7507066.1 LptA/OstA family protein [Armatimonadota bacterium]MDR7516947.1 LptA/OstA family protein [Armatimonadota bacterium]